MITHDTFFEIMRGNSLVFYYVYEIPFGEILEKKRFYWHSSQCEESIGPFNSLTECMRDHADKMKEKFALQRQKRMQELQRNHGGT